MKFRNKSQLWHSGNWIINLFVLLCNFNTIISQPCANETNTNLPKDWPCVWHDGTIPYALNFFSINPKRLISLVRKGHNFLQSRSCLSFKEYNPRVLANKKNFTYLFYSYSGVLEYCCLPYYSTPVGRRMVLITPTCSLPAEVGHATLHGMGLLHQKKQPFSELQVKEALFPSLCDEYEDKKKTFSRF